MAETTTSSSCIRTIPACPQAGNCCGSAPHTEPILLSPATEKSISRQIHLPPKAYSVRKRKVPTRKIEKLKCKDGNSDYRTRRNRHTINNCSIAMSRTESIMVSSAGDVIVCRCRRSSTPLLPPKARNHLNVWDKQNPCCDSEILSSIDAPWSPTILRSIKPPPKSPKSRAQTGSLSQVSTSTDCSTYEWENNINNITSNILGMKGLKGGSMDTKKDLESSDLIRTQKDAMRSNEKTNDASDGIEENHPDDEKSEEKVEEEKVEEEKVEEENSDHNDIRDTSIDDNLIFSLPSFDYSHIIDGHNDMVPQAEQKGEGSEQSQRLRKGDTSVTKSRALVSRTGKNTKQPTQSQNDSRSLLNNDQKFFHGVPLFLSTLSQVRITKVSANPLGAHVLMISQEALLFTYGLNHCGQLGIGFQSEIKDSKRGFHTTPTLITPLLENGGKAINCAAGVDHSLVVISTEGRRLQKLQFDPELAHSEVCDESSRAPNSPSQMSSVGTTISTAEDEQTGNERPLLSEKLVQYHQVYAFGRNNFMKLGLVRPHFDKKHADGDSTENVVLPRRVGLHCTIGPDEELSNDDDLPSQGVFDIAASTEHSAALVRRSTGDVEVYMWGNASLGALGLPLNIKLDDIRGEIARKPSCKKKNIVKVPTVLESLCHRRSIDPLSPHATKVSLGPYSSFVVMSNGKCMSCGFSAEGMLGHGYNTKFSAEPDEVFLPPSESDRELSNCITSVSAGAFHVLALSDDGNVYSWGINSNERLGLGSFDYSSITQDIDDRKENLVVIEWVPQKIDIDNKYDSNGNRKSTNHRNDNKTRISLACAGYDSSFIVTESGKVMSFGKRSGRLGKGEISSNVNTPQPLYGGLHLFRQRSKGSYAESLKAKKPTRISRRSISENVTYNPQKA